jgi:imidazoleglycerol-phosphate dehydratase
MTLLHRETRETNIELSLNLYGKGESKINTGIGFFDHMLELWSRHGFFDLELTVKGDLYVDEHHTVEDTGIILGQAIKKELGDKIGIKRYGSTILAMDETLVLVALDLSGRSLYKDDLVYGREKVGEFPVELVSEFFRSLSNNAEFTLHFKMLEGGNTHHLIEACFKGFARSLDEAIQADKRLGNKPLSTKGILKEGGHH